MQDHAGPTATVLHSKRAAIGEKTGDRRSGAAGDSTRQLKCFNPFRSAQQQQGEQGELGPHASRFTAGCGAQLARHACAPDGRAVQCGNPTSPPDPGNSGGRVGEQRVSNTQGVRVHLTHLAGMHAVSYSCRCAVAPSRAKQSEQSMQTPLLRMLLQHPGDSRIKEPASLSDSPLNHPLYTTSIPVLFALFVKRPQRPSPFFLLNAPLTDPHSLPCSQRGPCWPPPSLPPLSSPSRRRTSPSSRGRTTRSPGTRSLTWVDTDQTARSAARLSGSIPAYEAFRPQLTADLDPALLLDRSQDERAMDPPRLRVRRHPLRPRRDQHPAPGQRVRDRSPLRSRRRGARVHRGLLRAAPQAPLKT